MTRIALALTYDGRPFSGWQTQPSGAAIQDHLERALAAVAAASVATVCAGRTDAGVHATAQVVHFDAPVRRPLSAWVRGTNAHLPEAVAVQAAVEVSADFHARYSARRRRYVYRLLRSPVRQPLWAGRAGWVFRDLDVAAMRMAAAHLVGRHDFSAFRSAQCQAASPVRMMESLSLVERGPVIEFELIANAFLHHMVRNIVGSLVWVGLGRRPADWVGELLAERDRRRAAPTFAADGLYLCGVDYGEFDPGLGLWPGMAPLTS